MALKTTISVEQTLEKISSDNTEIRREGWRELHDHSAEFRENLNDAQMLYLRNVSFAEKDAVAFRCALKAMLALAMAPGGLSAGGESPAWPENTLEPNTPDATGLLAHWLWDPFHQPAAVLGVTETNYRRRDEAALLWLGRRLSFAEYPPTEFPHIALENPDLHRVLFSQRAQPYQAYCIVGRLGLFGQKALERLGNEDLQYGLDEPRRPDGLPPGALDARYHCIYERVGSCKRKLHRTSEENGVRTDFALVQRYQVELGTQHVAVVMIAGASSLGTMAGAQWAAYDMFLPTDAIDKKPPIVAPPRITPHSRMEALLCARARVTTSAWEHPEIELRKLSVDGACWSLTDQQWHDAPIRIITIARERGRPVQVLLNDRPSKLEHGRQAFRLTVALVEQSQRGGDTEIDISALAADDEIWDRPNPSEDHVRRQLRVLKTRHLKEALCMRGTVKLRAEVRDVDNA